MDDAEVVVVGWPYSGDVEEWQFSPAALAFLVSVMETIIALPETVCFRYDA